MVLLEMPNGARATLEDSEWSSSTLGLANLLEVAFDLVGTGGGELG